MAREMASSVRAPALALSLLSLAWFQARSKVEVEGALLLAPYPVCAIAADGRNYKG